MKGRTGLRATVAIVLAVALTGVLAAAPAQAYRFGGGPYDDAWYWAGVERCTGVSQAGLTALMLAASIAETVGASASYTPAPMTLGRADAPSVRSDNVNLFESKTTSTPYKRAFWHPGVGLYQLDSAGLGAPYTSAERISSWTSSRVTARHMAQRYCNTSRTAAQKRAAAWSNWFACQPSKCETIFSAIYQGVGNHLATTRDNGVVRWGGMVSRTCFHANDPSRTRFQCFYVNPANAQGWKGSWQGSPLNGNGWNTPTPLSYAFYTYRHHSNGREYRHWLRNDTGYAVGVYASRQGGSNARSTLVWTRNTVLCDTTTWRGLCDGAQPTGTGDQ